MAVSLPDPALPDVARIMDVSARGAETSSAYFAPAGSAAIVSPGWLLADDRRNVVADLRPGFAGAYCFQSLALIGQYPASADSSLVRVTPLVSIARLVYRNRRAQPVALPDTETTSLAIGLVKRTVSESSNRLSRMML